MDAKTVQVLKDLTELLAKHGVYALTIIFIFFMWRRALRDFLNAHAHKDKEYLRRIYTSVIIGAYVAMAISTTVWIYATFMYSPKNVLRGEIAGLQDEQSPPKDVGDPPKLVQSVMPEGTDLSFLSSMHRDKDSLLANTYNLHWALFFENEMKTVILKFQQHSTILKTSYQPGYAADINAMQSLSPFAGTTVKPTVTKRVGTFSLDPAKMMYQHWGVIRLVYIPNASRPEELGTMCLRNPTTGIPDDTLKWLEPQAYTPSSPGGSGGFLAELVRLSSSLLNVAFAEELSGERVFGINGEYDRRVGNTLRQRLAATDLKNQSLALDLIANSGKRSFKFITDCLNDTSSVTYDRDLLLSNLSEAVRRIEAKKEPFPRSEHLKFAVHFFGVGDYPLAAFHFLQAGDGAITKNEIYFSRGYAYGETGYYKESEASYLQYIRRTTNKYSIAVAHTNLGFIYEHDGQPDMAIGSYKDAVRSYPGYAKAHHALAGAYLDRKETYDDALASANKALELEPRNPNFYSTKGIVMQRMGKTQDAITQYLYALKLDPNHANTMNNLAYLYALQKTNLDSALRLVNRALEQRRDEGSFLDTKGWIYFQKGDYKVALEFLTAASTRLPRDEEINSHLKSTREAIAVSGRGGVL